MSTDEEPTIVVFRKWRGSGTILALFPEDPDDIYGYYCSSYEHHGQHAGADYYGCIRNTLPAKPEEYDALYRELTARGYRLATRMRASGPMHDYRRQLAAAARTGDPQRAAADRAAWLAPPVMAENAPPSVRVPMLKRLEFDDLIDE